MNKIPPSLINSFKYNNITFFIGSGFSNNANLPLWDDLIGQLEHSLIGDSLNDDQKKFYEKLSPIQKAQYLYDCVGKSDVIAEVKAIFERSVKRTRLHKRLMSFPVKTIITTNWDDLLEEAAKEGSSEVISVIWEDKQMSSIRNGRVLLKMHGTINYSDSIVFSEDDYYDFMRNQTLVKEYISTVLATNTIVFIGYSFNDFNFKILFDYVRDKLQKLSNSSYIFLPNPSDAEVSYLNKRGLKPIVFMASTHQEATECFIDELSGNVSVSALDSEDRLNILNRENSYFYKKAEGQIIRNHSNIGPLGTPFEAEDELLFSTRNLTDLESECAKSWCQLLENGAFAKCLVCLDLYWALSRYPDIDKRQERFKRFLSQYRKYSGSISLVDIGIPTANNINILGNEVCLESKRIWHQQVSYDKVVVHRELPVVAQSISEFDAQFEQVKNANLKEAEKYGFAGSESEMLDKLIERKVELILLAD
ncbi:SIR2 family NAD-dependent protein deacylase [Desulfosediminicola ganghwensis]|uniref:SIR2 family NAD-dependent protein deacylase n=1 Tax=Desulfosediminicola ganghwensis TaxID=2569540 RepID=UPI0010AB7786|nr:SIR2 family protein [Desulfosediminicola ganghwensis]